MTTTECLVSYTSRSFAAGDEIVSSKKRTTFKEVYDLVRASNPLFLIADAVKVVFSNSIPKQQLKQLYNDNYVLVTPVVFDDVDVLDGIFYIYNREFRISGAGKTLKEAKEEAAEGLIDLYDYYNKSNREKTEELLDIISKLNKIIKKKSKI